MIILAVKLEDFLFLKAEKPNNSTIKPSGIVCIWLQMICGVGESEVHGYGQLPAPPRHRLLSAAHQVPGGQGHLLVQKVGHSFSIYHGPFIIQLIRMAFVHV